MFIGGSSGSALSGALRYLHSSDGKQIASDPNANVIIIFPDGVRNYMSKPWFLENASNTEGADLRDTIRQTIGRDLGDVKSVAHKVAPEDGKPERGAAVDTDRGVNGLHVNGSGEAGKADGQTAAGLPNGLLNPVALAS